MCLVFTSITRVMWHLSRAAHYLQTQILIFSEALGVRVVWGRGRLSKDPCLLSTIVYALTLCQQPSLGS